MGIDTPPPVNGDFVNEGTFLAMPPCFPGVSLPPPAVVTCEIPWPRVGAVMTCDDGASGTGGPPDLPPPRA